MRTTPLIISLAAAALSLVLVTSSSAKKPKTKPTPCTGRYVITQGATAIVSNSAPDPAIVVVDSTKHVSLGAHCGTVSGAVKALKSGTNIAASFKSCGTTLSKVKLKASIPTGCGTMSGVIKAKKLKPAQHFQASLSRCGDGVLDRGAPEACEGTVGCDGGQTCTAACTCLSAVVKTGTCTKSTTVACSTRADCPIQPVAGQPGEGCCGNGVVDGPAFSATGDLFGETCDLGKDMNCASLPCSSGCTSHCTSVGSCTGNNAQCGANADCGGQGTCCGNHIVDPGETCDDGNSVDGASSATTPFELDGCPASCHVETCTATATTLATSVTYMGPAGVTIAGLGIYVDYPEGKVSTPVFTNAFGVGNSTNDPGYGFVAEPLKLSGLPKPFMHATYATCQGAAAVGAGDFKCTVTDASDDQGNTIPVGQVTCAVTIP